jgi:hypothetical protein
VRIDTTVAPYRLAGASALATVVYLSGQLRVHQNLFLQTRWGFADNRIGNGAGNRTGILNPSFGLVFAVPLGTLFRFAASTAIGLPIATGGEAGDTSGMVLQRQAALARSAMENNAFIPNNLGAPTGVSVAFVHGGVTAQLDTTMIPAGRVKGPDAEPAGITLNSTSGFFFGYFVIPEISVGFELRYQRFILAPPVAERDPTARDNLTAGAGGRLEIELSYTTRMRPGICFSTGLVGHVEQQSYRMLQFDVPISF